MLSFSIMLFFFPTSYPACNKSNLLGCHESHRYTENQRRLRQEKHPPRSPTPEESQPSEHSSIVRDSQTALHLLHRDWVRFRRRVVDLLTKSARVEIERITSQTDYETTNFGAVSHARKWNRPSVRWVTEPVPTEHQFWKQHTSNNAFIIISTINVARILKN